MRWLCAIDPFEITELIKFTFINIVTKNQKKNFLKRHANKQKLWKKVDDSEYEVESFMDLVYVTKRYCF